MADPLAYFDVTWDKDGKMTVSQPATVSTDASWYTGTWKASKTWVIDPPKEVSLEQDDIGHPVVIEGEFQGRWYKVAVDFIGGESPVAAILGEVLGMVEGETLGSFVVVGEDGSIDVRSL